MNRSQPPLDPHQSVEQWARESDFPQPIRWGEIEAAILSRSVAGDPPVGPGPSVAPAYVLGVLVFGAPLFGLALVLAMLNDLVEPSGGSMVAAELLFVAAAAVPPVSVNIWNHSGRLRSWPTLLQSGGTGLAALATVFLAGTAPLASEGGRLQWIAVAAALSGFGVCLYLLVASKGWRRRTPRRLRPRAPEELVHNRGRAQVLATFVDRGLVSERDICIPDMLDMPLGSWRELDPPR